MSPNPSPLNGRLSGALIGASGLCRYFFLPSLWWPCFTRRGPKCWPPLLFAGVYVCCVFPLVVFICGVMLVLGFWYGFREGFMFLQCCCSFGLGLLFVRLFPVCPFSWRRLLFRVQVWCILALLGSALLLYGYRRLGFLFNRLAVH